MYVPSSYTVAVREWLTYRPAASHDCLFAFDTLRRLHEKGLVTIFEAVKSAAGMQDAENVKPHSIRHWRATDLLRSGADLKSIQAFLGHNSLRVTAQYLYVDEQRCRGLANLSDLQPEKSTPKESATILDERDRFRGGQQRPRHRAMR